MVTVAVDATPTIGRRTGIGAVVSRLLTRLERLDDLDVVGYGLTVRGWRQLRASRGPGRSGRAPMPAGLLQRVWARADRPSVEWWTGRVEVVHGTNYVVPPTRRAARLVSVHDLTAVRFPELCSPSSLRYPALVRRAVAHGAVVHTAARAMADEICEHFCLDAERVHVIGVGVDLPTGISAPEPGPPYILGLGTVEPRKDFPLLVRAFDQIAEAHPDLCLRIVGSPGWGEAALSEAVAAAAHRHRIHRQGWVDDVDGLLANATVFAYPSIYEGFGLPPLEAMARGVPVVATAAGAIPEIAGDGADLVPVGDADALAAALCRAVDDEAHRRHLVEAGRRRVRAFSWPATATAMGDLYRRLAGGVAGP